MEILVNFLLGILASIIAGIILIMGSGVLSRTARWVLTATLGRILDIDIEYVFNNSDDAKIDIAKELERAKVLNFLTGRGNQLQRPPYASLFEKPSTIKIRILLPNTQLQLNEFDWIAQRENELTSFDTAYRIGHLKKQIELMAEFLNNHKQNQLLEVKAYNAPHIGRILLTDRCAYFTPYRSDAHGRDVHVIKYRRGGDMYDWLSRCFNQLWEMS